MVEENTNEGEGNVPSPREWMEQKRAEAGNNEAVVDVEVKADEDGDWFGQGAINGIQEGLVEAVETVGWAGDEAMFGASELLTGEEQNYYPGEGWLTREQVEEANRKGDALGWQPVNAIDQATDIEDPSTTSGQLASGVSQFLTGYGAAGKMLKGWKAGSSSGNYVKSAVQGGMADFMAFDAHEERFSDFLRDNFGLQDPITEYLASDEDDSVLEGKLKNTLEGFGLGVATDAVVRLARGFKKAKKVQAEQGDEAAAEAMNKELEEATDDGQLEMFTMETDPNMGRQSAEPNVRVTGGAGEAVDDAGGQTQPKDYSQAEAEAQARMEARQNAPDLDTGKFQEAIDREIALTKAGAQAPESQQLGFDYFNWDKMDSDSSTKDFLRMAVDAVPDDAVPADGSFAQWETEAVDWLADSIDGTPDDIRSYLRQQAKDADKQSKALLGGKMMFQSLSREIEQLAFKISAGQATDMDYNKMVRLQSSAMEIVADVKSLQKSAAQTTAAGRIHTTDMVTGQQVNWMDIQRQLDDELNSAGGQQAVKDLADEIVLNKKAGGGNGGALRVTANRSKGGKFWQVVNEVRINGLLSGPRTHMINAMSNAFQMGLLPAERVAGGLVSGDLTRFREGMAQYVGMSRAIKDSLKFAAMAGWKGRNILDPEAAILEANGVDFRAIQSKSNNKVARGLINAVGMAIRVPSRFLSAGDELFKQMNYRSEMYARLTTQATDLVSQGKITKKEAAGWVEDRMRAGIGKDGRARDLQSLNHAREATFTNELRQGSFARKLQNTSNAHPWMKVVIPFVRTPTNIIVAGAQRTPLLRRASKNLSDDLKSGDPSRVASARGKLVSGNIIWGTAIMAAMEGKITGGGPSDPAARKRLMETGWRPYSWVRQKSDGGYEYVEYRRADPFAMFFGIAADVAEIGGQTDDATMEELGKAALTAFANNVGSKTWLQGITDAAEAYANPDMSLNHYLNNLGASFLPYSSAMREARKGDDPYMREVETMLDAVKNTIPGYSEDLPARRSMITGEPVTYPKGWGADMVTPLGEAFASSNPIYAGDWKEDPVLDELARLGEGVTGYPSRKINGVELTPEQYSAYVELHGKVRPGGTKRNLYQELDRLIKSPMYDVNRERAGDTDDPAMNSRIKMVRRVITGYRELARAELMQRYPELGQAIREREMQGIQQQKGLISGITELGE